MAKDCPDIFNIDWCASSNRAHHAQNLPPRGWGHVEPAELKKKILAKKRAIAQIEKNSLTKTSQTCHLTLMASGCCHPTSGAENAVAAYRYGSGHAGPALREVWPLYDAGAFHPKGEIVFFYCVCVSCEGCINGEICLVGIVCFFSRNLELICLKYIFPPFFFLIFTLSCFDVLMVGRQIRVA